MGVWQKLSRVNALSAISRWLIRQIKDVILTIFICLNVLIVVVAGSHCLLGVHD